MDYRNGEQELLVLDEKEQNRQRNRRRLVHVVYGVIIIAILLLWKCCSGKMEKEYEQVKTGLMIENCSLRDDNNSLKNGHKKDSMLVDSLAKRADSLQLVINELENRKAVLVVSDYVNEAGDSGKLVKAIIVNANDKRKSTTFIKDVVKKVIVPIENSMIGQIKTKYTCLVDTFLVKINESSKENGSKSLYNFEGYRTFPNENRHANTDLKSCFDLENSKGVTYSRTINQFYVDKDLVKRSKTKNWIATGMRVVAMAGYATLHHSTTQLAITANGIPPYDNANPFLDRNLNDQKIAGQKAWIERGIWATYLGGEVLGYSARRDLGNAYSSSQTTVTFTLNFGKK